MTEITPGMHDDPRMYPLLPGKMPDEHGLALLHTVDDSVWQTCWEYKMTHVMSELEGSAFWHGANIAMKAGWQAGHDEVCEFGKVCSKHQPIVM